jgi:hypothetical protein
MLDPDVRRGLDAAPIAHLATILQDGSPHSTPLYVGAHGKPDRLLHRSGHTQSRNLRRDPRLVALAGPSAAADHGTAVVRPTSPVIPPAAEIRATRRPARPALSPMRPYFAFRAVGVPGEPGIPTCPPTT